MSEVTKGTVRFPDGHVLLRNLNRDYPVISHGQGLYLFDRSGKRYIDASGGALVTSVGHGNAEIARAIAKQLEQVAYVNGTQFTSQAAEELAAFLCGASPGLGLTRCSFLSSGSEAVEAAMKFARQLWMERGESKRYKVIARTPGYHGNTLFALSASGRPHYRKYYGPLLHEVVMIPAPYRYRSAVENYDADGAEHYARALEEAIEREGADTIAAFFVEPVIGSSAGAAVPPSGYFDRVQKICRKNKILIIADEIMCGAGRTGRFFACDHFGLKPDLLLLGKGVSGGYIPLSVLMAREEHVLEMQRGSGGFMHAQTFMQSPSMVSAGLACMRVYARDHLVENAAKVGHAFQAELRKHLDTHPHVGAIDGIGLMAGVELTQKGNARPKPFFARAEKTVERFVAHAFDRGLVVWPNVGHVDGVNGDLVMLGPPLNITEAQAAEIALALREAVDTFFKP